MCARIARPADSATVLPVLQALLGPFDRQLVAAIGRLHDLYRLHTELGRLLHGVIHAFGGRERLHQGQLQWRLALAGVEGAHLY